MLYCWAVRINQDLRWSQVHSEGSGEENKVNFSLNSTLWSGLRACGWWALTFQAHLLPTLIAYKFIYDGLNIAGNSTALQLSALRYLRPDFV